MKGLLYCDFLLNKKWLLGAGIVTVIGTAALFIFYNISFNEIYSEITVSFAYMGLHAVVAFLCTEWLGRSLESNIKCRFADYVLTSGISKRTFVLAELTKNILSLAISYLMCMVIQLAIRFQIVSLFSPLGLLNLILIVGVLRWITSLVTLSLRNAEISGLIVTIAFVLVMIRLLQIPPADININDVVYVEINFIEYIIIADEFLSNRVWIFQLVYMAVIAAIYVIAYVLFLRRIRRGDVCK